MADGTCNSMLGSRSWAWRPGGELAETLCAELAPDVLLMDVSMPGIGGVEATRRIHERHPGIRIIGLSMITDDRTAKAMLEAGAVLCVGKDTPPLGSGGDHLQRRLTSHAPVGGRHAG